MRFLRLKTAIVNLERIEWINLYFDRKKPMVQVCFSGDNGFLNLEDPADVKAFMAIMDANSTDAVAK